MITRVAGLALMVMGLIFSFNIIPLSIVDTVSITTPKVMCSDDTGKCTVDFSFTNVNATSSFLVYVKVVNSLGQTVVIKYIQVDKETATTPIQDMFLGTFKPGTYIVSMFAISSSGAAISKTASTTFNVGGKYQLVIFSGSSVSGSVTPVCAHTSPCSYDVGSKVNITYTPAANYEFAQWNIIPSNNSPFSSKQNPLSLTMNVNYEVILDVVAPNAQYFIVTPIISLTGCSFTGGTDSCGTKGTIDPSGDTKVYQDSAYGVTSIQFTATPNANFTFKNWQTNDKNFSGNPLTLRYSDLKPLQTSGQTQFYLYAYFKQDVFYQLGVGAYPGITTTPAAKTGTYTYPEGEQVTVSVSNVSTEVCFSGWIVDGKDVGKQNSVTVTMDAYHSVYAQGFGKPSEGCEGGGDDGGDGGDSALGLAIGLPMIAGGAFLTFFGKKRR